MADRGDYRRDRDEGYLPGYGRNDTWIPGNGHTPPPYNYGGHYSDYGGVPFSGYYGPGEWTSGAGGRTDNYANNYAGHGPRSYRRSDERISDDINEELTRHAGIDATDIDVIVNDGEVTLNGSVADRRTKRMARDVAESCSGVRDVHNRLRIR